ncbi:MAG: carboxypeptidase-like regulatory domain-containing protein [Bryobacteraceae bacterium]|nr:carboxypeptidase-like regulatory domain-containing protein [Bryobacteraceae bacterium]
MLTRRSLFLALPCLPLLRAEDLTTRLRIEVKTKAGNPIDRAAVVVNFVQGRSAVKLGKKIVKHWELRTNQEGWAKIPPIPQGKLQIQVIAKGYQTFGQTFDVNEEERTIEIKLNEPQEQHSVHGPAPKS